MQTDRIWTLLGRKLAGESSPEEQAELDFLFRENPDTHLKMQALVESWSATSVNDEAETEKAFELLTVGLKEDGFGQVAETSISFDQETIPKRRISLRSLMISVAVFAFAATGIFLFLKMKSNHKDVIAANPINTISTKYGSRTKVELPDGSVVWLNAGSKITYNKEFGNSLREVNLTGEAYFNVVHNAEKPFIIHTAFFDIKDLGTQFNVKCYPEDKTTETSLVEGSVEITVKKRPKDKWILKPNEKLVLLNEAIADKQSIQAPAEKTIHVPHEPIIAIKNLTYLPQDSFAVETAWTYNKLSFEDEAFSEVVKKMARWYDAEFEFRNSKFSEIHMSGSFVSETLSEAMEALKYTHRINYEIKDRKVIIY